MCWDTTTDQRMVRYPDLVGGPTIHTAEVCGKDLCKGGVGDRVRFQYVKCPIVHFELSVHKTSDLIIILNSWMANILHTMHKCPRFFEGRRQGG